MIPGGAPLATPRAPPAPMERARQNTRAAPPFHWVLITMSGSGITFLKGIAKRDNPIEEGNEWIFGLLEPAR
jgi:hypothetical protein